VEHHAGLPLARAPAPGRDFRPAPAWGPSVRAAVRLPVTQLHPRLGERCHHGQRKVKQALFNLLTNAVKFTPDSGAVSVSARRADGWVEVAVQDTGVGIAPEEQGRVFEEFGQARSASGQSEGTGLGLTLCKRYVELHGGTIGVASEVGRGSTFTVSLPVRQPAPPAGLPGQP
jgi:signal transduction histidine kinase